MTKPDDKQSIADESLADIAFLSNSANRLAVLGGLCNGPHSRHVLAEMADVSRVTLSRILDDLEDRSWISQEGTHADITPLGVWVLEEFKSLTAMLETERSLRDVIHLFPEGGFGFHISALASADITLRSQADPSAPIATLVDQLATPDEIHSFSFSITKAWLDACWRRVTVGELTWGWVCTPDVIDVLKSQPEMARQAREILDTGRAEFYINDDVSSVVLLSEGWVHIRVVDEEGIPAALIQTDNEDVWTWAESTFETYRREGTPVDPAEFTV